MSEASWNGDAESNDEEENSRVSTVTGFEDVSLVNLFA